MNRYLFYAMRAEKMCFLHVLMNAIDLAEAGHEVRVVFEGEACKLPPQLDEEKNKLFLKAGELGLIAGACRVCSVMMKTLEANEKLMPLLDDMNGHAGMKPFIAQGYVVISM